jgi:hypothetical protein
MRIWSCSDSFKKQCVAHLLIIIASVSVIFSIYSLDVNEKLSFVSANRFCIEKIQYMHFFIDKDGKFGTLDVSVLSSYCRQFKVKTV